MTKLIIAGVILVVALLVYAFLKPHKEIISKNIRPGTKRLIVVGAIVIAAVAAVYIFKTLQGSGEGLFLSDKAAEKEEEQTVQTDGNTVTVSIEGDTVTVGGKSCSDMSEASKLLYQSAAAGNDFLISDNYAKASTYEAVLDTLKEIGVDESRIREIREP